MAVMDVPLHAWLLFRHAARHFADTEVVTRRGPGDVHLRYHRQAEGRGLHAPLRGAALPRGQLRAVSARR